MSSNQQQQQRPQEDNAQHQQQHDEEEDQYETSYKSSYKETPRERTGRRAPDEPSEVRNLNQSTENPIGWVDLTAQGGQRGQSQHHSISTQTAEGEGQEAAGQVPPSQVPGSQDSRRSVSSRSSQSSNHSNHDPTKQRQRAAAWTIDHRPEKQQLPNLERGTGESGDLRESVVGANVTTPIVQDNVDQSQQSNISCGGPAQPSDHCPADSAATQLKTRRDEYVNGGSETYRLPDTGNACMSLPVTLAEKLRINIKPDEDDLDKRSETRDTNAANMTVDQATVSPSAAPLSENPAFLSPSAPTMDDLTPAFAAKVRVLLYNWLWIEKARAWRLEKDIAAKFGVSLDAVQISPDYVEVTLLNSLPTAEPERLEQATLALQTIVDHYGRREFFTMDVTKHLFDERQIHEQQGKLGGYVVTTPAGQKLVIGETQRGVKDVFFIVCQHENDAKTKRRAPPHREPFRELNMKFRSTATIHIFHADITCLHVDAVVSASDSCMNHVAGVAGAISRAAGQQLQRDCDARVDAHGPLGVGDTHVTAGHALPSKFVIHAVGPSFNACVSPEQCNEMMYRTFANCLLAAEENGAKTIAIPAVSSGVYAVPLEIVSRQLYQAVTHHLRRRDSKITGVLLVDLSYDFLSVLRREFATGQDKDLVEVVG